MTINYKISTRLFTFCTTLLLSYFSLLGCNDPHDHMVKTMSEQSYCFEKATDNLDSSIILPISQLHLNGDNSFYISSNDPQLAQIKGEWDLCCYWSEYGNYVFKIDGMKDWKQANPDFYVMRDGKKIRLFYKICN